jgi:hypothetical protein
VAGRSLGSEVQVILQSSHRNSRFLSILRSGVRAGADVLLGSAPCPGAVGCCCRAAQRSAAACLRASKSLAGEADGWAVGVWSVFLFFSHSATTRLATRVGSVDRQRSRYRGGSVPSLPPQRDVGL